MSKLWSAEGSWTLQLFWGRKPFPWVWVCSVSSPWGLMAWFCGTLGIKPPKWLCHPVKLFAPRVVRGQAVISVFIYCLRILHIYAAKGMRAYTLAAAERMKLLRRLDAKEHRGKVIWTTFFLQTAVFGMGMGFAWLGATDALKNPALSLCYCKERLRHWYALLRCLWQDPKIRWEENELFLFSAHGS